MEETLDTLSLRDLPQKGVMAVFIDADHTSLTIHTCGSPRQHSWEKPWKKNIRAFQRQKQFFDFIRTIAVVGCISFNEYKERLIGTYQELGFKSTDDYLLHAELVNKEICPEQGKNKHIAECLLQHYARDDAQLITKIIVMDDDPDNIINLKHYYDFVSLEPYSNEPRLKQVEIVGKLVPKPVEIANRKFHMKAQRFYKVPILELNQDLKMKTTQEEDHSQKAFIELLEEVEKECLDFACKQATPLKKVKRRVDHRLRLTCSLGNALNKPFNEKNSHILLKCSV